MSAERMAKLSVSLEASLPMAGPINIAYLTGFVSSNAALLMASRRMSDMSDLASSASAAPDDPIRLGWPDAREFFVAVVDPWTAAQPAGRDFLEYARETYVSPREHSSRSSVRPFRTFRQEPAEGGQASGRACG
jgi:hypothetical protein